jgi:hypothetical protein
MYTSRIIPDGIAGIGIADKFSRVRCTIYTSIETHEENCNADANDKDDFILFFEHFESLLLIPL